MISPCLRNRCHRRMPRVSRRAPIFTTCSSLKHASSSRYSIYLCGWLTSTRLGAASSTEAQTDDLQRYGARKDDLFSATVQVPRTLEGDIRRTGCCMKGSEEICSVYRGCTYPCSPPGMSTRSSRSEASIMEKTQTRSKRMNASLDAVFTQIAESSG